MRFLSRRFLRVLLWLNVALLMAGVGFGFILSRGLPSTDAMDLQRLPQMTVLLDRNGGRLYSFAEQRRTPVTLDKISPIFVKALLATEDPRFERHIGIDLKAIARAGLATATTLHFGQGGSTITQQLARDTFLYPSKTVTRKLREMILALSIERRYTKREILELYCNRIYLGHGRYGIEAASEFYFNKKAKNLTLPEAALLAGLPQRPEGYSPIKAPRLALARRAHVLDRMVDEGVLTRAEADAAKAAPLGISPTATRRVYGQFFVEEVRRFLLKQFGEEALYRSGLQVRTTLDPKLQRAAERAVAAGLDEFGRRHRSVPVGQAIPENGDSSDYDDPSWSDALRAGDIVPAVATSTGLEAAEVRIGARRFTIGAREIAWTGRRVTQGLIVPGKIYPVKVLETDGAGAPTQIELASDPNCEAAFLALDPRDGEVLALVGGKDFDRSEFDRATQAARQAGSAFKPFIYVAALEQGISPGQLVWDVPTVWTEPGIPAPYKPENYDQKYEGLITLQHALDHSRNIPTVRLLDALGYAPAIEMGKRLGVHTALRAYPSLALGAFEVKLIDIVAAYGAFANGGTLVAPRMVRSVQSADGQELWSSKAETKEVLTPEVAAQASEMLKGPTTRGTAADALRLGRPTIGKTGTTDDYTDAWFIGATPSVAAGAWLGYDQRQSLGRGETGSRAALPIWLRFMDEGLAGRPSEEFPRPQGMETATLDLATGLRGGPELGCEKTFAAPFPEGKAPQKSCTTRDHLRARLPYPIQGYPLTAQGALVIPTLDAARLTTIAPEKFIVGEGGKELHYSWGDLAGTMPLAWSAKDFARFQQEVAEGAEALWAKESGGVRYGAARGRDDWPAQVEGINRSGQMRPLPAIVDP